MMSEISSLIEVEQQIKLLAKRIRATSEVLPTFGVSRDFGYPHIEIVGEKYCYVVVERGHETKRFKTTDIQELLYAVFFDSTKFMAMKHEVANRVDSKDSRRIIFSYQEHLMGLLFKEWQDKCHDENSVLLKSSPYDDFSYERAMRCKTLRDNGYSSEQAWAMACNDFPLPN